MDAVGVPKDLQAIDAPWLEGALRAGGCAVNVTAVGVEQIAVGAGYIGLLARLTPTYGVPADDAPASLIVKIPSPEPGPQLLGAMLRLWEREGRFYRDLAPTIGVRVPGCFLSEEDPDDGRVVLLLEDLGAWDSPDQLAGTTLVRAEQVIDWLADYHASTWATAADPDYLPWIPRTDDPIYTGIEPLLHANLAGFAATFADVVTPERLAVVEKAVGRFAELLAPGDDPVIVGHGDFRLDNMLFGPDDELAVLDWQLLHIAPGTYDLTYFIVESLTIEQRRAWEPDLVNRYHARVAAAVGPNMSRADLGDRYRDTIHFLASLMPVTQTLDFNVNDRSRALASSIVDRVLTAADDHPAA